jgi:hypothetical protein
MTNNFIQVKAKQSFYHDLTGARAKDEIFQIADQDTFQTLEQAGYVCKADLSAEAQSTAQEFAKNQEAYGQAQAKANEAVSTAQHVQNMEANQHTQDINQAAQQRMQQASNSSQTQASQADQKVAQQTADQHEPAAVFNTKATAKKANVNANESK